MSFLAAENNIIFRDFLLSCLLEEILARIYTQMDIMLNAYIIIQLHLLIVTLLKVTSLATVT